MLEFEQNYDNSAEIGIKINDKEKYTLSKTEEKISKQDLERDCGKQYELCEV